MAFSHRDLRALRELGRATTVLYAVLVALTVGALLAPSGGPALLTVVALAAAGGAFLVWSEGHARGYARDLALVREGALAPARLRTEVGGGSGIDRDAEGPAGPSPHRRGGRSHDPGGRAGGRP